MNGNAAANLLLMLSVGLLSGSIAATGCLVFNVDPAIALLSGAIAAVWSAALIGIFVRW